VMTKIVEVVETSQNKKKGVRKISFLKYGLLNLSPPISYHAIPPVPPC
jgi:hypothetical protein